MQYNTQYFIPYSDHVKGICPFYYEFEPYLEDRRVGHGRIDIEDGTEDSIEDGAKNGIEDGDNDSSSKVLSPAPESALDHVSSEDEDEEDKTDSAKKGPTSSLIPEVQELLDESDDDEYLEKMLSMKHEQKMTAMKNEETHSKNKEIESKASVVQSINSTVDSLLKAGVNPSSETIQSLLDSIKSIANGMK